MTSWDWPEQLPFTLAGIARALSRAAAAKADDLHYMKAVSDIAWRNDEGIVTARVQGTAPEPYTVRIGFVANGTGSEAEIDGHCTCPMIYNCKHGGATLLEI